MMRVWHDSPYGPLMVRDIGVEVDPGTVVAVPRWVGERLLAQVDVWHTDEGDE